MTTPGDQRHHESGASDAARILEVLALSERLKRELRHSWLADGRQESVAEHCWQMALMAILVHPHLTLPVDLGKALRMIVVHDLAEAEVGDIPSWEVSERKRLKSAAETAAIGRIRDLIGGTAGAEIHALWHEYETRSSNEARFVHALDNLKVQIQHNLADLGTWEPVEYPLVYTKMDSPSSADPFLQAVCDAVKSHAEAKMKAGGIDVDAVKAGLATG